MGTQPAPAQPGELERGRERGREESLRERSQSSPVRGHRARNFQVALGHLFLEKWVVGGHGGWSCSWPGLQTGTP